MELQLKIIGMVLISLGFLHVAFPKRFDWKTDLSPLSLINRQMMQVHTFFVALTVSLMGILCICAAHDLINTNLGRQVSLGLSVFWGFRLIIQFFFYSPQLWKGKMFETSVHIIFSILWTYLTVIFMLIYLGTF